ncbi:hypothetical protein AAY473_017666 [Plecturocebus cupreus]
MTPSVTSCTMGALGNSSRVSMDKGLEYHPFEAPVERAPNHNPDHFTAVKMEEIPAWIHHSQVKPAVAET